MSRPLNDPGPLAPAGARSDDPHAQLAWRVPVEDGSLLRAKALQLVFAGLICLGVVVLFGSRSLRLAAILGAIPLGLFLAWRWRAQRRRPRDSQDRDSQDNVRLDAQGLHWRDGDGRRRKIGREQIESFRIGLDPDTIRALPALTLILAGGFESQPVELHAPAGASHVRQFLVERLQVVESREDEPQAARLHEALRQACEHDAHLAEMRVLSHGLCYPQRLVDRRWQVAVLADGQQVVYDPVEGGFEYRDADRCTAAADLKQLAQQIARDVVDAHDARWLRRLDDQHRWNVERAVRGDAGRLGFYVELDSGGLLHLEGSRRGLTQLCDRMAAAADQLGEAPPGARPDTRQLGGTAMRLQVMLDQSPWCDEATLAGPRGYLHAVAEQVRRQIADEPAGDFLVKIRHGEDPPQPLGIHLRGEPYDPLAALADTPPPGV